MVLVPLGPARPSAGRAKSTGPPSNRVDRGRGLGRGLARRGALRERPAVAAATSRYRRRGRHTRSVPSGGPRGRRGRRRGRGRRPDPATAYRDDDRHRDLHRPYRRDDWPHKRVDVHAPALKPLDE